MSLTPPTPPPAPAASTTHPSKSAVVPPYPSPATRRRSAPRSWIASTSTWKHHHVDYEKLADKRNVEDSKTSRARVQATRERQVESFSQISLCLGIFPDASYDGGEPLLRAGKEYIGAER